MCGNWKSSTPEQNIMTDTEYKKIWDEYRTRELEHAGHILAELGYSLDKNQVHIGGERYLMMNKRDVGGGGYKLVLLGKRISDSKRVVIKFSSEREGMQEIESEHRARHLITNLDFAYHAFSAPKEFLYSRTRMYTVSIVSYIAQENIFLSRPLSEQFALALRAFKTQEGVHATTYAHAKKIRSVLGLLNADEYVRMFRVFKDTAIQHAPENRALGAALGKAQALCKSHKDTIEQYCGFLTHSDFVPHNLRIADNQIYLLDYASIHFGNKHESWARFLNFMMLYNPPLEQALMQYVRDNRTPEEYLSLRLMRIYKLGFLLQFYASTLQKTSGDARTLTEERISFWTHALESLLDDQPLSQEIISGYEKTRDELRSEEEKNRQKELH
jgi:hypothetical protein